MVRLLLSLFLFVGAGFDVGGVEVDRPLAIAGLGVATALLATIALDLLWLSGQRGNSP